MGALQEARPPQNGVAVLQAVGTLEGRAGRGANERLPRCKQPSFLQQTCALLEKAGNSYQVWQVAV